MQLFEGYFQIIDEEFVTVNICLIVDEYSASLGYMNGSGDGDGGEQSLLEMYWATIDTDGVRFFEYSPGIEPNIDPDYIEKIIRSETGT